MQTMKKPEDKEPSLFEELYAIDVSEHTEQMDFGFGPITVLPWAKAWHIIRKFDSEACFVIFLDEKTGLPFFTSEFGLFVHVSLTIKRHGEIDWYPVEGGKNGITVHDIANAHQRALVKCAGRHGLGLSLWEKGGKKNSERESENPASGGRASKPTLDSAQIFDFKWKIPFGKFKDRIFESVPTEDLQAYVAWLETDAAKKGEPLKGNALTLKQMTDLRAKPLQRMLGHKDYEEGDPGPDLSSIPF